MHPVPNVLVVALQAVCEVNVKGFEGPVAPGMVVWHPGPAEVHPGAVAGGLIGFALIICGGGALLAEVAVGINVSFVSGRDGIDLKQAMPRAMTIGIANQGNGNDIRTFVDWKIDEKSRDRPLTENMALLQDIKERLLERADRMFLWVSLQLDMLWEECHTDAEIQTAMNNLPKDLSETYSRCLARINRKHNRLAQKVLYWVCVAIKPLEAPQMQEALAMDPTSGLVDPQNMLPIKEIIKLCSHLIIQDTNDRIRLTHASVSQFLEERSAQVSRLWGDYTLNNARAELGDLCMTHLLSSDFGERCQSDCGQVDVSPFLRAVKKHVPYAGVLGLWTPRTAQISWPPKLRASRATTEASAFFHFASYHWARLTDGIDQRPPSWSKFRKLALEQHFPSRVHPWESIGQSADSHFVATLGWAIANRHEPLFSLIWDTSEPKMNKSVFNIPLYHYNNIPLLHLSARNDFPSAVRHLLKVSKHPLLDQKRRLALHHAAETGSLRAMGILWETLRTCINDRDVDGYAPLHLAAMNKRNDMIELLSNMGASLFITDKKGQTPLSHAVENFDYSTVRALISNGVDVNTRDSTLRSPLMVAAEAFNPRAVALLIANGADVDLRDKHGYRAIDIVAFSFLRTLVSPRTTGELVGTQALYLAIEHGNVSVVDCLVQLGANLNWRIDQAPSPISLAVRLGNFAIAELLVKKSTSTDDRPEETEEPLWARSTSLQR